MRTLLYILPILCLLSCSKTAENHEADIALQTAKAYYDQLLAGDYNAFVEGSLHGDSVPADYKEQLILNAKMFIEQQNDEHQGIEKIEANRASCDSTKSEQVNAVTFLTVFYKDGSKEEISVPMIRKGTIWYLR